MPKNISNKSPRERLRALPEDRQAQLLDPAEAEFATKGFAGASLNCVLDAAGMSKGQAYYYITGKSDLYVAVMERALLRFVKKLNFTFGFPTDADAFWQQVNKLLTRITETFLTDTSLAAIAQTLYENETTRRALPDTFIHAHFEALIALGQSLGAVRTDLPNSLLMNLLFTMGTETDRWFAEHWQELNEAETMRLNGLIVDAFRSIASPPGE